MNHIASHITKMLIDIKHTKTLTPVENSKLVYIDFANESFHVTKSL